MKGISGRNLFPFSFVLKSRSIICLRESLTPCHSFALAPFSSYYQGPEENLSLSFFRGCTSGKLTWSPAIICRSLHRNLSYTEQRLPAGSDCRQSLTCPSSVRYYSLRVAKIKKAVEFEDSSQQAVTIALWCNFLVFSLKFGVWIATSSHVMLAEVVHSVADFANQALLAYGLSSSKRGPDALHPYGYSKERFVWSLISAVGIFCLGSGATIVHGFQNLWVAAPPENIKYAAIVICGSFILEGASLLVAIKAVKKGAAAERMSVYDYVWRGHDPTSVAVMTEDGAAVTGLVIAGASLVSVQSTGNPIYDPIGSIIIGNLLGMV
ncbi:hypothetical protein HPP92_025871 [Vanilla planifolia]|uniref:Cation efflux protein transmembrane domain-containing protein n=1 Tax=Vanilla planifolia TaxID=51239 RepID=A0A835PH63_VANPL|nr:hypothetical protein HPP92_025871 [Vanilla planifolia]